MKKTMAKEEKSYKCETGFELLSRLSGPSVTNIEPTLLPSLMPPKLIEITGDSGTGKTEFLYHFISQYLIPSSISNYETVEKKPDVIVFDLNYQFSILRLSSIFESKLLKLATAQQRKLDKSDVKEFIKKRLRCLHIVRCKTQDEFVTTLMCLEGQFASRHISMIMIDGFSTFHWMNRLLDLDRSSHKPNVAKILTSFMTKYNLVVVVTVHRLTRVSENNTECDSCKMKLNPQDSSFLGQQWMNMPKIKFVLMNGSFVKNETHKILHVFNPDCCKKFCIEDAGVSFSVDS